MFDSKFLLHMIETAKLDRFKIHEIIGLSQPLTQLIRQSPTCEDAEKIADYFNVSMDVLFGRCTQNQRNEIINSLRTDSPYPYNLVEQLSGCAIDWEFSKDNYDALNYAINDALNDREKNMLISYFNTKQTFEQIGDTYDLTKERVRQIIAKSLRKLRHPRYFRLITQGIHSIEALNEYTKQKVSELDEREKLLDSREQTIEKREQALDDKIEEIVNSYHVPKYEIQDYLNDVSPNARESIILEDMNLSVRTFNCLYRAGLRTLKDVASLLEESPEDFVGIRSLGKKSAAEIVGVIDSILNTDKYEIILHHTLNSVKEEIRR